MKPSTRPVSMSEHDFESTEWKNEKMQMLRGIRESSAVARSEAAQAARHRVHVIMPKIESLRFPSSGEWVSSSEASHVAVERLPIIGAVQESAYLIQFLPGTDPPEAECAAGPRCVGQWNKWAGRGHSPPKFTLRAMPSEWVDATGRGVRLNMSSKVAPETLWSTGTSCLPCILCWRLEATRLAACALRYGELPQQYSGVQFARVDVGGPFGYASAWKLESETDLSSRRALEAMSLTEFVPLWLPALDAVWSEKLGRWTVDQSRLLAAASTNASTFAACRSIHRAKAEQTAAEIIEKYRRNSLIEKTSDAAIIPCSSASDDDFSSNDSVGTDTDTDMNSGDP